MQTCAVVPDVTPIPKKISNTDIKSMIENNASITYRQDNPKREGSKSFHRYEKYKVAKTIKEFFDLGGSKADLSFDLARGFLLGVIQ